MSNNKFKVLIVEDEANICSFIETLLTTNDYQALVAHTCTMGLTLFASHNPDLVILDLGLPDRDGLEFIRTVRQKYMTPIVVLSARTDEMDKIEALDLGANDYITKPFSTGELLARVRAALRLNRYSAMHGGNAPAGEFRAQGMRINYDRRKVFVDCLTQAVVHGGEHSVAGHGSTGNSVHTAGGTGLGQLVCQSFSSGTAQFGSLAGSIDLHTGHPAAGDGDGDGHITQAALSAGRIDAIRQAGGVVGSGHSAGVLDVQAEHNCHNDSDNSHDDNIPGEFLHKRSNAPF